MTGRLTAASENSVRFADDLHDSVAWGDDRCADLCRLFPPVAEKCGWAVPELPHPPPFRADAPAEISTRGLGTVVYTSGYRPRYHEWIEMPDAFDDLGFPHQHDGASTSVPGLYFMGTHFLRKRKSSTLFGMGEDAAVVARKIVDQLGGRGAED